MKKIKCIKLNEWPNGKLTIGKLYEFDSISIIHELEDAYVGSTSSYYIKDDNGEYKYFLKEWFIDIEQDRDNKLNQLGIC
jgi:hypothetical protein